MSLGLFCVCYAIIAYLQCEVKCRNIWAGQHVHQVPRHDYRPLHMMCIVNKWRTRINVRVRLILHGKHSERLWCNSLQQQFHFTMENFMRHGENNWRLPANTVTESMTPSKKRETQNSIPIFLNGVLGVSATIWQYEQLLLHLRKRRTNHPQPIYPQQHLEVGLANLTSWCFHSSRIAGEMTELEMNKEYLSFSQHKTPAVLK